jgi:hypothetical protein
MFQCMEMGDVLKILCNLEKGPTKFWNPRPEMNSWLTCCKLWLPIIITMEWQYMHWEKSQKN